jgi:hypothetical protein
MADEIRIQTVVDMTGLRTGQSQAQQITAQMVADLKAQYAQASAAVRGSLDQITSAQENLRVAVERGTGTASQWSSVLSQQREKAGEAVQAQAELKARLDAATRSLNDQIGASTRLMTAQTEARFSAQLLARDIGVPIPRALSAIAAQSETLGPLLRAAFPVVGAVALTEVLFGVGKEVYKLYDNFINLKEVQEEVERVEERLAKATVSSWEHTQKLLSEHLRDVGQFVAAAKVDLSTLRNTPIDLGQFLKTEDIDKKLGQLPAKAREVLKQTFTSVLPEDVAPLTDKLQKAVTDAQSKMAVGQTRQSIDALLAVIPGAGGAGLTPALFDERKINQQKALADIYSGLMQYLGQEQQRYAAATVVATDKVGKAHEEEARKAEEAARKMQAAFRQQEEAVAQHDKAAMTQLELSAAQQGVTGQRLFQQKVDLLARELSVEQQYPQRVETINAEIARILEESHTKAEEAARKGLEIAQRSTRQLAEEYRHRMEVERKNFEDTIRQRQKELEEANEITRGQLQAGTEANVGRLQLQKLQVERSYSLGGDDSVAAKTAELAQLRAIDKQMIDEQIQTAKALAAADLFNDPKKYATDLQEIARLQRQSDQQQFQETTQILQLQQQRWNQYFQVINSGFEHAFDEMIRTGRNFQRDMQEIGANLVVAFANNALKMELQWAEMELKNVLTSVKAQQLQVTTKATGAAQSIAITQTTAAQEQLTEARKAFWGGYNAVIDIPVIGPILAPITGAASAAAIMAFDQGGIVPATDIAMLHKNEMVLDPNLSGFVQSAAAMASGQKGGGNSSTFNINQTHNYNGMTDANYRSMATKNARHTVGAIRKAARSMGLLYSN